MFTVKVNGNFHHFTAINWQSAQFLTKNLGKNFDTMFIHVL